jgi:uncharacterized protein YjbJ (UPF0337 family)
MEQENDIKPEVSSLTDGISGTIQKIIGDIEMVGGVLTGDPITQAEGEFNVEVGEIREDLEEQGAESEPPA